MGQRLRIRRNALLVRMGDHRRIIHLAIPFTLKRHLTYLTKAVGALFLLSGCTALEPCTDALRFPILFDTGEDGALHVETRAMSTRTSAAGFTCMAVSSSGTTVINNVKTSTSGSYQVVSGRYWPATGTLSFYGVLPNASMLNASGTVSVPVGSSTKPLNGTEDWIVAASKGVSNATSPIPMTFSHILAHIERVRLTGSLAGATTVIRSITFTHPTYGIYNLTSGSWDLKRGSARESLPGPGTISGTGTGTSAPDLSVIPGTYTLTVSYNVTSADGASESYTKAGSFTLTPGKRHTIAATLSDSFQDLEVSVSVSPWTSGGGWQEDFIAN